MMTHYRYAAALALGLLVGWVANGWRMDAQLAEQGRVHEARLRQTAEANAAVIRQQQAARLALENRLADLDTQHYTELTHARENSQRLAADLSAATRRLSVRARCPAAGMPAAANASGVDHGSERADIHPEDARRIVGITGDADACAVKLTALQGWARTITAPK